MNAKPSGEDDIERKQQTAVKKDIDPNGVTKAVSKRVQHAPRTASRPSTAMIASRLLMASRLSMFAIAASFSFGRTMSVVSASFSSPPSNALRSCAPLMGWTCYHIRDLRYLVLACSDKRLGLRIRLGTATKAKLPAQPTLRTGRRCRTRRHPDGSTRGTAPVLHSDESHAT